MSERLNIPYIIIRSPKFVVPSNNTSYSIYIEIDLIQELRVLSDLKLKRLLELARNVIKKNNSSKAYDLFSELVLLRGEAYRQQKRLSVVKEISSDVLYFSYEFNYINWVKLSSWVKEDRPDVLQELMEEEVKD